MVAPVPLVSGVLLRKKQLSILLKAAFMLSLETECGYRGARN